MIRAEFLPRRTFLALLWWRLTAQPCPWRPPEGLPIVSVHGKGWLPNDEYSDHYIDLQLKALIMLKNELDLKFNQKGLLPDFDYASILRLYYEEFEKEVEHYNSQRKPNQRGRRLPACDAISVRGQASFRWGK